ncbi:MAG TPA: tRNA dihydrouridine synthase DusB [Firmicutes bacterium]|nr:tRNA dihydrouridine synthase DusB [Bacillota bacterium]
MKTFSIADTVLKNRYVEAPLAGFSDVAMRILAARFGAGLVYTEMISAAALSRGSLETINMVKETKRDEAPVALQLFGSDEEELKKAIKVCEENGRYNFLDFNIGCPVPKVMKQDAGSHLLTDLDKVYRLVKAMVDTSQVPVIVKSRLGYSNPEDCVKIVDVLQSAGVSAIAMHGRTRNEFYLGLPHYDLLKKAKEESKVPFIANGNIGVDNALEILAETGADAVMLGRKAIGNPMVFKQLIAREEGEPIPQLTLQNQVELMKEQLELEYSREVPPERISVEFRAAAPAFFQGFPNSRKIRSLLVKCSCKENYIDALNKIVEHRIDEDNKD